MPETLLKKFIYLGLSLLIIVTCTCCQDNNEAYLLQDYLSDLTDLSDIETTDSYLSALQGWGVIGEDYDLKKEMDKQTLAETLCHLLAVESEDYLKYCLEKGYISNTSNKKINKEEAILAIEKAVNDLNNQYFSNTYTFTTKEDYKEIDAYLDNNLLSVEEELETGQLLYLNEYESFYRVSEKKEDAYVLEMVEFLDVIENFSFTNSSPVDLQEAEITFYDERNDNSSYINHKYDLLSASKNKGSYVNHKNFDIDYSLSSSSLSVNVKRKSDSGLNLYTNLTISEITPYTKMNFNKDELNDSYFKLHFKASQRYGVEKNKSQNYHQEFSHLISSDFLEKVTSVISNDVIQETLRICRISVPIADIPFVKLNLDLSLNIYASGKLELAIVSTHNYGYETRNGYSRFINDCDFSIDPLIRAGGKTSFSLGANIEALSLCLSDIEAEAGAQAYAQTILHLYGEDGNYESVKLEKDYDSLNEASISNVNVKVCGDVSLNWLANLNINSSKTLLAKFGLSKSYPLISEEAQIFGNLSHIENGQFVEECTVGKKEVLASESSEPYHSEKISLSKYALVIKIGESVELPIRYLPDGYSYNDLVYVSEDSSIASIENNNVIGKKAGATKIRIYTNDEKYEVYCSILVSDG